MITYTPKFLSTVQGRLKARFDLQGGQPRAGIEDGEKFYYITLMLDDVPDAVPVEAVTYFLDAATYWEPERVSRSRARKFAERITSYGDFIVRVQVKLRGEGTVAQQALLSDMLDEGHPQPRDSGIDAAINDIRIN